VGCVRSKNLRPASFLDIKANKNEGGGLKRGYQGQQRGRGSEGQNVTRPLRLTEIEGEGIFRQTAKKLGTFSSISLGLQEKVPK